MCGRYALYKEIEEIEHFLGIMDRYGEYQPNYNVAPTQEMPVCYAGEKGERILATMHWGFMGWKPKPGSRPFTPVNTRDDSLPEKPMWKKALQERRCIIPANGFYEWTGTKKNKIPHFIYPRNEPFFGFAGIYSNLAPDGKTSDKSYSIITTTPNRLMEDIHDRMPAILHPEEFSDWLNPANDDIRYLTDFLQPYADDAIDVRRVSDEVNNVRNTSFKPDFV